MDYVTCFSPDDLAKVFGMQKSMYDSGASPQVTDLIVENLFYF